jgi:murein DD-endopeptidase MepM/ murein hydrolase activator NlpD
MPDGATLPRFQIKLRKVHLMPSKLLPTLHIRDAGEVNLNNSAIEWVQRSSPSRESPLVVPEVTQKMIDDLHARREVKWSYGGYLEDRSTLLKGTYLDDTGGYIHLGVDVNVAPGTTVAAPYDATVVNVFDDTPTASGWGPRLILRPEDTSLAYLILGHLTPFTLKPSERVKAGQILAEIAPPPRNGNWFPHLHIQQIARHSVAQHEQDNYESLDGYGHPRDLEILQETYPDPTWLVRE